MWREIFFVAVADSTILLDHPFQVLECRGALGGRVEYAARG